MFKMLKGLDGEIICIQILTVCAIITVCILFAVMKFNVPSVIFVSAMYSYVFFGIAWALFVFIEMYKTSNE